MFAMPETKPRCALCHIRFSHTNRKRSVDGYKAANILTRTGQYLGENEFICRKCSHSYSNPDPQHPQCSEEVNFAAEPDQPQCSGAFSKVYQPRGQPSAREQPESSKPYRTAGEPEEKYRCTDEDKCVDYLVLNFENFSRDNKRKVLNTIGETVIPLFRQLANDERFEDKTAKALALFTKKSFLDRVPDEIRDLMAALSVTDTGDKELVRALEAICQMVHRNFVSRFSFAQSAIIGSLTTSKAALDIISASLPSGTYKTFHRFLRANADVNSLVLTNADIITIFDNQQIIARNYSVKAFVKQPISKCTAVLHATYPGSMLQLSSDQCDPLRFLGPGHLNVGSEESLKAAVTISSDDDDVCSYEMKRLYVEFFPRVEHEEVMGYGLALETMGCYFDRHDLRRSCFYCEKLIHGENARKCKDCGEMLPAKSDSHKWLMDGVMIERRDHMLGGLSSLKDPVFAHVKSGPRLEVTFDNDDPMFTEPNSKAGCRTIVDELGRRLGVMGCVPNGIRKFAILCCDGQPYDMIRKMIRNTQVCSVCKELFKEEKLFLKHNKTVHKGVAKPSYPYSWLLLHQGFGHLHMNLTKQATKTFWHDFFKSIFRILQYRTDNALNAAKRAGDTHKTYEIFCIARYAIMLELISKFKGEYDHADLNDFSKFDNWARTSKTPNIRNCYKFLRYVIQPVFIFRAGLRRNNPALINAGLKLALNVFWSCNAPKYRQILLHTIITRARMPTPLREFFEQAQCVGEWGEAHDFKLEVCAFPVLSFTRLRFRQARINN